jgi:hypothetical protein
MNQAIVIASIGIILLLYWIVRYLILIHEEVSKIRKLLASTPISTNNIKDSQNIRNQKNNVKESL